MVLYNHLSTYFPDKKEIYESENCHCGKWDAYPSVEPFCAKWFSNLPAICLLKGRTSSRYCPGARKLRGRDIYLSSDYSICNASQGGFSHVIVKCLVCIKS